MEHRPNVDSLRARDSTQQCDIQEFSENQQNTQFLGGKT